jgi:hypothetical protein
MSVPELFIRRPVMTTLVMSGILLFGIIGFEQLPVSDLPSVDYPTIQVSASLLGHRDTAGKTIFHHRRRGQYVVGQLAGRRADHHPILAEPRH